MITLSEVKTKKVYLAKFLIMNDFALFLGLL